MGLTEALKRLDDPALTRDEQAMRRSEIAADLIHAGKYEDAREALGSFFQFGERPDTRGLKPTVAAEIILRCGTLTGWLGSVRQIPGAQESAKDLLSEAERKFRSQGERTKAAEVGYELGMCYFRLGAYDEARVVLEDALRDLDQPDLQAKILIRRTMVDVWTGRYHEALELLKSAQPFFEGMTDAIKGKWHGQLALVYRRLATAEQRSDYSDRAVIEFTAAAYHLEAAGHERYCAVALNNLAMLLYRLGRYAEAHENLDRASGMLDRLQDEGLSAQVQDTQARVLNAEGNYHEALRVIDGAIKTFERGGERALLADALTIRGTALARTGEHERSIAILRLAFTTADESGATSNAAHAALTLIEEHAARLTDYELYQTYQRADDLSRGTQDVEDLTRLRVCARAVMVKLYGPRIGSKGFSLRKAVLAYEARFIEYALRATEGSVTKASRMLGIGYQSLGEILKTRHKQLQALRTPPTIRKRSSVPAPPQVRPLTIFHVEDNQVVAGAVKDTLEMEGWKVETCADGTEARRKITGKTPYELLLLDYDLPGVNGLELLRLARRLAHRRRTPIIMFSASDVETEAWRAGVSAYLRKPEDVLKITDTITRLMRNPKQTE